MIAFTICSRNFTAYAKTLFDSLHLYHRDLEFYMFLADDLDESYNMELLPFKIIPFSELGFPDLAGMSQRYNITEFNTSLKPFAFLYLFRKLNTDFILYFDPDILITSRMVEILEAISNGTNCIMTPHLLEPIEHFEISDQTMLLHGIYNLGFIGLRNVDSVIKVVEWWCRRMVNECVIDLEKGLFVDQKWADLLPGFLDKLTILRHPGYNVAYWNIYSRKVTLLEGVWYSNGFPLRFFHFSGNNLDDPDTLSRHTPSYNSSNIGDVKVLLDIFRAKVLENGYGDYIQQRYSFKWGGLKGINTHAPIPPQEIDFHEKEKTIEPNWIDIILVARYCHGGWFPLISRGVKIIFTSGIKGLSQGLKELKSLAGKTK